MAKTKENNGFDLGVHAPHAPFLLIFTVVLIAGVLVVSGAPSANGATRSFEQIFFFGGTQVPEKAAFSNVNRVTPFGDQETISNCDNNVLLAGWVDVLDHESMNDPFNGIFNNIGDLRKDMNSVSVIFEIDGQPVSVTASPSVKYESLLGTDFKCDDNFADLGLTRSGDEGCWGKTFSVPLKLAPGSHDVFTQYLFNGEPIFDTTKTLDVQACMQ